MKPTDRVLWPSQPPWSTIAIAAPMSTAAPHRRSRPVAATVTGATYITTAPSRSLTPITSVPSGSNSWGTNPQRDPSPSPRASLAPARRRATEPMNGTPRRLSLGFTNYDRSLAAQEPAAARQCGAPRGRASRRRARGRGAQAKLAGADASTSWPTRSRSAGQACHPAEVVPSRTVEDHFMSRRPLGPALIRSQDETSTRSRSASLPEDMGDVGLDGRVGHERRARDPGAVASHGSHGRATGLLVASTGPASGIVVLA